MRLKKKYPNIFIISVALCLTLCNYNNITWLFNALTFARSLRDRLKPQPLASVFNSSLWTLTILMHEKPCLIPILYSAVLSHLSLSKVS